MGLLALNEETKMSKMIDILDVVKWLDDNFETNTDTEMRLRDWLKSKLWDPEVGEICEFSDDESFPDNRTAVGYFAGKTDSQFCSSKHKHLLYPSCYFHIRPIKGGRE
jgi:hypothetical protein